MLSEAIPKVNRKKTVIIIKPMTWFSMALKVKDSAANVISLIKSTMIDWKTALISGQINLIEVNINRGIFQEVPLSPLIFVISLIPLTLVLRRTTQG